jgi:hypothetical protein
MYLRFSFGSNKRLVSVCLKSWNPMLGKAAAFKAGKNGGEPAQKVVEMI